MNSRRTPRPQDRITDNRAQFHLRWRDHLETLPPVRMIHLNRHLPSLHASLSPPGNAPRPHPAADFMLLTLVWLLGMTLLLTLVFLTP